MRRFMRHGRTQDACYMPWIRSGGRCCVTTAGNRRTDRRFWSDMSLSRNMLALVALLAFPFLARPQDNTDHYQGRRVFSEIGRGVRGIHRGPQNQYYVLVAPSRVVLVFDSAGKRIGQVPTKPEGAAAIVYGTGLDVDQNENVRFVQSRNVRFHGWPRGLWKRSGSP